MKLSDKIKRNFEDLNFLRENQLFKEILLKDFERSQQTSFETYPFFIPEDKNEEFLFAKKKEKPEIKLNKHLL